MLSTRVGLTGRAVFTIMIPSGGPVNLRTLANAAGYDGTSSTQYIFKIDTGSVITASTTGTAAVTRGTFGASTPTPKLVNRGTIKGAGGAGGAGGNYVAIPQPEGGENYSYNPGGPGGAGGTALDSTGGSLLVDNQNGTIGGGGGGNGGDPAYPDANGFPQNGAAGASGLAGSGLSGANGAPSINSSTGGAGGAAGNYATGNANITWIANGTRLGGVS